MRKHLAIIAIVLLGGLTDSAAAIDIPSAPAWDRASAMAVVRSVNIDQAVNAIGDISTLADGATTLKNLHAIASRSDWQLPAREAALYQFTRSLADLPRDAVAVEVMQYLRGYQAQVLVPHEDHVDASVPLFNIRGAAAGVENGWLRAEAAVVAQSLLATNPAALVAGYLQASNRNQRSGYLDALHNAALADVWVVQTVAVAQLGQARGLTRMVGLTAAITGDTYAAQQLLIEGKGAGLTAAMGAIAGQLHPSETAALLALAIQQAPATNAALAIAAWWPRLRHDAAMRQLLLEKLADPDLGAAAALALARSPDIQTIKELQDTAAGNSAAARRAQMALDINRNRLLGEVRR